MKKISSAFLASALIVSAMAVPAIAATQDLTAGTFAWPIKTSFMEHLAGPIAAGRWTTTDGATYKDNQLLFPVNVAETTLDADGNGTIVLDGSAHIVAYKGLGAGGSAGLDLTYSDLKLQVQGTQVELVGDYVLSGDPGDKGTQVDRDGDDDVLVTFTLDAPIAVGTDVSAQDRPATAGAGLEGSLLRYKEGQILEGGDVDLVLDFADGKDAGVVEGHKSTGLARASAQLGTLSSEEPSSEGIGILVGMIAGVVALVGTAVAGMPLVLDALKRAGIRL